MGAHTPSRSEDYSSLIRSTEVDGSLYIALDIFAQELERIWYKTWVFVGYTSEVLNSGDYIIPPLTDDHSCAQRRRPLDMMRQG